MRATWAPSARRRPGQAVQLVADGERHEVVPRAVELDLVDAVAVAVEGLQPRRVLVGLEAPARSARRPTRRRPRARARAPSRRPRAASASTSGDVVVEEVAVLQRRDLVGDLVGRETAQASAGMGGSVGSDGAQAEGGQLGGEARRGARRGRRRRPDERLADRADERRRAQLAVLRRQLAGGDAVAQDRGEDVAVGAAEDEALGLDGRVDRLGEQRPGQPPSGERALREDLDGGRDPGARAPRAARPRRRRRRRPRAATRCGRPRRTARPWTGSGGRRCPSPRPRGARPRPPTPRGSRRGRSAHARRGRSARGPACGEPPCARSGGRSRKK